MTTATQDFTGTFKADQAHSSFQFALRHMNVSTFRASFQDVDATLEGDEEGLSVQGRARVDSVTITSPAEFREHVVNGADFFDASNHPEIGFRSLRVALLTDGTAVLDGVLEIKGIEREVTAAGTYQPPVEDPHGAVRAALEVQTVVDRRDWGMDWQMQLPAGGDALGYEVELTVHLHLVKQG